MKRWISAFMMVLFALANHFEAAAQQRTDQGERGTDSIHAPRQGAADTPGAEAAANQTDSAASDSTAANSQASADSETAPASSAAASDTPPVEQTTTSGSGSPAVLAGEHGNERDGTNNVQRASMNMAGAPATNLDLADGETVDADSELVQRRDRTQDKAASARSQAQRATISASEQRNKSDENVDKGLKASGKEGRRERADKAKKSRTNGG